MVAKVNPCGRSFKGVAAYCLHDAREEGEPRPESADRVEWAETRRLTSRIDRAAAQMAATAGAAPELKRMAGIKATGRKLAKPVLHYSLSWPPPPLCPPRPRLGGRRRRPSRRRTGPRWSARPMSPCERWGSIVIRR